MTSGKVAEQVFEAPVPDPMLDLATMLAAVAGIGLAFQVGHFAEHAIQFAVWILGDYSNVCGRDTPWMSPWVTEIVRQAGTIMFPAADARRQMMMGMEVLHLIGNSIFLISLGCFYYCLRSKWVRWALYVEGFHLYEHLMLTLTAYFVGKPIGLSTLFGGADIVGSREFAVGYRVAWHFAMNLLPMPFAMIGLIEHMRRGADVRTRCGRSISIP
ncbi:DUF6008 family protein [Bradyrhizobium sp. AUGA SZCCT0431]|uniref:DUF6008 family protein n=1 Tax=Bradyrhizobium sp. AUGA SZCCT0431 TaxID=2807674 RepID=UPI001BA57495|nr:DUF6008 family protein [Bradyrhizobium sp. AUGA SZCCT0431]MBR1147541.1 hypothetical protein [Bradyrhizobium sp. AUGA SZCCT0431]